MKKTDNVYMAGICMMWNSYGYLKIKTKEEMEREGRWT